MSSEGPIWARPAPGERKPAYTRERIADAWTAFLEGVAELSYSAWDTDPKEASRRFRRALMVDRANAWLRAQAKRLIGKG